MKPISDIAGELGLKDDEWIQWGRAKAKIPLSVLEARRSDAPGKLVLVTAMTPTPAGEGKTTTAIGLSDGLRAIGKKSVVALREPSLGPCFGRKGGGTGNGQTQVVPADDINFHFTGDLHAVTSAHNLLSAMIDNHLFHGNELGIDPRNVLWPRVMDMNDRALREIVVGHAVPKKSWMRHDEFRISAASEIMAVLCLSKDLADLKERLSEIVVGLTLDGDPVQANALGAVGSMAALLKDAIHPNLVQTKEGTPALVHGGPFANIAHGCNSIVATQLGLRLGDILVTEAGFGSDLGAEKFFDIKCPTAGLKPHACVIVATVRALRYHGGVPIQGLQAANARAVEAGLKNLGRHIQNAGAFGVPACVAINHFPGDTEEEIDLIKDFARENGLEAAVHHCHDKGAAGGTEMAELVIETLEEESSYHPVYEEGALVQDKIRAIAFEVYGATGVNFAPRAAAALKTFAGWGYDSVRVCMAKTPASITDDSSIRGAPSVFDITITDAFLSAGAGFVVALCGNTLTMPGLAKNPNATQIDVDADGTVTGLF